MDGSDRGGDDRTFRVNFSGEGAARLRERVKEKLKEFMGDYTDDTLVEYVIVLLRNGRRKEEAMKELHVFLGDDSASFISWLWDYLSSNLHLYMQSGESIPEEGAKTMFNVAEQSGRIGSHLEHANDNIPSDSDGREKSAKFSRDRRNREWKGLVHDDPEPPFLLSSQVENFLSEEKPLRKHSPTRQSPSPRPRIHRKRNRQDERNAPKRDTSKAVLAAPRRLLQFAVRDAVRTAQQTTLRSEPALKRLRSVVSTSTTDPALSEPPQRVRSLARVPGAMATVIKAAAAAAEDATKVRSSGNVFDRLGHGMDKTETVNQTSDHIAPILEDGEMLQDFDQIAGTKKLGYLQSSEYNRESAGDITMLDRETGMASDYGSDNDRYDDVDIIRQEAVDVSQSASSTPQQKDSLMVQYSVAQNAETVRKTKMKDQEQPVTAATNASRKIVNISVNVNTWKPPHYEAHGDNRDLNNQRGMEKSLLSTPKLDVQFHKGNNITLVGNEDGMNHTDAQKDTQKPVTSAPGSYPTGRPSEDVESRTVFVGNVHFAATKDTLSRHFNKFGEVLKVVIVTDAATGQPKGSAYVEFLRKESAELALSLNNTSFMSRILRVVRRSSAHHEASPMMSWPRIVRASPFASRLSRMPFPRGIMTSTFRGRPPIKPGARSLQWKRDGPPTLIADGTKTLLNTPSLGSSMLSPTGRNLTYVRTEPKPDANLAPA